MSRFSLWWNKLIDVLHNPRTPPRPEQYGSFAVQDKNSNDGTMKNTLTTKQLLTQLKEQVSRANPEVDAIADALEQIAMAFDKTLNRGLPGLINVVASMKSTIEHERIRKHCVQDYFTGNGPVGKMVKQYILIDRWASLKDLNMALKNCKTEQLMNGFVFPGPAEHDTVETLNAWLGENVHDLIYADSLPLPVLRHEGNITVETTTGFYRLVEPGEPARNAIVLSAELPGNVDEGFGPARVVFVAASRVPPKLFYYHPYEDEWVTSGYSYFVGGTMDLLKEQFERAMERHKTLLDSRDWNKEIEAFKNKADWIFDNSKQLPDSLDEFKKEGSGSHIEIEAAGYALTFCCSGDEYAFRSCRLTQQYPQYRHVALVTSMDQMETKDLNVLFYHTQHCLDKLESKIKQLEQAG